MRKNLSIGIIVLIALVGGVVLWDQKSNQQNTNQIEQQVIEQSYEQKQKILTKNMKKQLPNLEYKDNLEVAVTLFEEKQSIDWSSLAYRNYNESFSGDAQFFKTSSLTTLVYHNQNNNNINVGGYIFRNIDKNAPRRAGFIEDQIFVTAQHNAGGWFDWSQSFMISVKKMCDDSCKYDGYSVSDQEVKEILDILLEQEYILQNK